MGCHGWRMLGVAMLPNRLAASRPKAQTAGKARDALLVEFFAAPVAQLDRALPSEGRGHRFESCRVHHNFNDLVAIYLAHTE